MRNIRAMNSKVQNYDILLNPMDSYQTLLRERSLMSYLSTNHSLMQACDGPFHSYVSSSTPYFHSYARMLINTPFDEAYEEALHKEFMGVFWNVNSWKRDEIQLGKSHTISTVIQADLKVTLKL